MISIQLAWKHAKRMESYRKEQKHWAWVSRVGLRYRITRFIWGW